MSNVVVAQKVQPAEFEGWRSGRPLEDPSKLKRWGLITAKPSEFLVHCRRGRVLQSSGQGATCFKWPWDSVAIVPTSLQRVRFVADQVTRERVGVAVTGLAVYRIAHPLLAFRVLNFSYAERAQQKLDTTLTHMLVGATRRLVANLTVDQCLQERKQALADELLREISPVVGGQGRAEDHTDQGWGVVLDTVEVEEVRILSEKVFAAMQEPFRAALDREAREARAIADKQSALSEAESYKETENARITAEASVQLARSDVARNQNEEATKDAIRQRELQLQEERARSEHTLRLRELAAEEARADIAGHELKVEALKLSTELERSQLAVELDMQRARAEAQHVIGNLQAEESLARAKAAMEHAQAKSRVLIAEKLPELASAVGSRFGEVKVTSFGGDNNPFGSIAQAVASVLELAKEAS